MNRNPPAEAAPPPPSAYAAACALHQELGIVTWVWDAGSGQTRWSGDLSPLLGLPAGAYDGSLKSYMLALHPADREMAHRRMKAAVAGQIEAPCTAEERVIWPDGSLHWIEAHARSYLDSRGHVVRVSGVLREIARPRITHDADGHFRQLIEQAPAPMCVQRGLELIHANARFARLFGFESAAAVAGTPVLDLIAPDRREAMALRYTRRQASLPEPADYELEGRRLDGQPLHLLISASVVQFAEGPAVLATMQDLGDVLRARQALQQERNLARQYLDVAQATLVALDCSGRIRMLNPKGHALLGWADGELLGRDWFETCIPAQERERAGQHFRAIVAGIREPAESSDDEVITRDGSRRLVAWRTSVLRDEQGRITGTLGSGEDITDRRRAELQLRALNERLERRVDERTAELVASNAALVATNAALADARDAAEAGTRAKSSFLANMSHELRTPLNAVLGMSELALRLPAHDDRARDCLHTIRDAGQSLLEIIDELLDFSKFESGQVRLEPREFDLDDVIEHVHSISSVRAGKKGLEFQVARGPGVPRRLVGDPLRIAQVLNHLCGNAVKFTAAGRIVLAVDRNRPLRADQAGLRFSVRDSGVGIENSDQARLFAPFTQLDATSTRSHGGTGLGLAISRQLVELMGGTIGVSSEPGRGSEFHFDLTLGVTDSSDAPAPAEAAGPSSEDGDASAGGVLPALPLQGARILVVEDNEVNRIVASIMLRDLGGAEVTAAGNGQEALARLREQRVDLVLMDLQMPVMDGLEATRRIRSDPHLASIPVLAITANAQLSDRESCRAAGMDGFVSKPFRPQALVDTLVRLLRKRRAAGTGGHDLRTEAPPAVPAVPGVPDAGPVEWASGLEQCMGQEAYFRRLLTLFVEGHCEDAERIDQALERKAPGDAAQVAHKLVASAGVIGAARLSALARELLNALRSAERSAVPALLERLRPEHAAVLGAVRERLARSDQEEPALDGAAQ